MEVSVKPRAAHSEYDPTLRRVLDESGVDPGELSGLDFFGLLPFVVIAGGSVRTIAHTHSTEVHVEAIVVELDDMVSQDAFLATLRTALTAAYQRHQA